MTVSHCVLMNKGFVYDHIRDRWEKVIQSCNVSLSGELIQFCRIHDGKWTF